MTGADDLLAGPRGRRLCLAFAHSGVDDPDHWKLRAAVMRAGYELDPGRGRSVKLLSSSNGADDVADEPAAPSPEQVAELIDRLPLPEPNDAAAMTALRWAVDWARYWQEPDGEDVLAAGPRVGTSLLRVAELLLDSAATRWWADPIELGNQWSVRWIDPDRRTPEPLEPSVPSEVLARWRAGVDEHELRAARDRPADPSAPWSGAWWSRPPGDLAHSTRAIGDEGPLGLRLVEDSLGWELAEVHRLRPPQAPRVFEIDGPAAWAELCRRYPLDLSASYRHDWYRTTGRAGSWLIPDWSLAANDFDAVHLSVLGYLTTAGLAVPVDERASSVLAGWDPDQTWWLITVLADPSAAHHWVRSDDTWSRQDQRDAEPDLRPRRFSRLRRSGDGRRARRPRPRA